MIELVLATRNRHKAAELRGLLGTLPVRIRTVHEWARCRPVEEHGDSFEANAVAKAVAVSRQTQRLALADDSGLCVEALGGGPGVFSSRFAGRRASNTVNTRYLLGMLHGVPTAHRRAAFRCCMALAHRGRLLGVVHGKLHGRIADHPAGRAGFGYDPLFVVPRYGRTLAELGPEVKQRLSHRARAARRARRLIQHHLRSRLRS